jgi:hypothetical protein
VRAQDGSFSYPADGADFKYLMELRAEAEYYCLAALVEHIDRYPARQLAPAPASRPAIMALCILPTSMPSCLFSAWGH